MTEHETRPYKSRDIVERQITLWGILIAVVVVTAVVIHSLAR